MGFNTYPYSPFPASTEQLHKGDNEDLQAQIDAIKDGAEIDSFGDVETALGVVTGDITGLETDKADLEVIAPEFDAEAGVYAVGDLVMYQGKLYEFTTAHETAGDWDSTEVTEKTVADEIDTVKSGLTNVETAINGNMAVIKVNNAVTGENNLSYPSGYNRDNTIIIAGMVKLQHETYFNPVDFDYIVTRPNNITCKITNANVDYTYYVVVAKKDIPA